MTPFVVDIYHGDPVQDFGRVKAAGIVGIIHKATQGGTIADGTYGARRRMAMAAGLLFGAYHFNDGSDVPAQVEHFLQAAKPDANTLMALDFEDNTKSQMSIEECGDFLDLLGHRLGRKPIVYSGNRMKEQLPKAGAATQAFIASHKLWLCQYGPVAKLPPQWSKYFLWQYTGDGIGPQPHSVPGIPVNGLDLNTYAGTADELAAEWAA